MSCKPVKRMCDNLVVSDAVTFVDDTLLIDIPTGVYGNGEKYCIVVAQDLPDTATINSTVAITIGGDTDTTYPLVNCDCSSVYSCSINTRTRYSTIVKTNIAGGVFKLLGKTPCSRCGNRLASLPAPAADATA